MRAAGEMLDQGFSRSRRARLARHTGQRPSLTGPAQLAHTSRSHVMRSPPPSGERSGEPKCSRRKGGVLTRPRSTVPASAGIGAAHGHGGGPEAAQERAGGGPGWGVARSMTGLSECALWRSPPTAHGDCAPVSASRRVTPTSPIRPTLVRT